MKGHTVFENFAWSYPSPFSEYAPVKDRLGIYPGRVDRCLLEGELVRAQPGGFYGGWVTDVIKGPYKGDPESQGW